MGEAYFHELKRFKMRGKCLEPHEIKHKIKFNDPFLPKHVDEKTTYGAKTKIGFPIDDVIFPNKSGNQCVEDENKKELYKISHHAYETEEQLNRKYSSSFNPNYRYGMRLKRLPAGVWFKNNVQCKTEKENNNTITNFISKLLERDDNEYCCRYPYVDNRLGKFTGRSRIKVEDILTGNDPDEKQFEYIDFFSAVNKTKNFVKKKKYNLKTLREMYRKLDKAFTGCLPLDQVYRICYDYQIRPEKKLFDLALNSINAIINNNVRYELFVDLLDPNVQFLPSGDYDRKTDDPDRFIPTYKDEYKSKLAQSIEMNKKNVYSASSYTPVKPIILAHQDCFGYDTDVKTLLNPTIFTNYGLTYRDFFIARSKDVMEKLVHAVGMTLPNDIFNVIWDKAYQCDGVDGKVSVEVFRQALQEFASENICE